MYKKHLQIKQSKFILNFINKTFPSRGWNVMQLNKTSKKIVHKCVETFIRNIIIKKQLTSRSSYIPNEEFTFLSN